jgi:hypothetical protein
MRVLGPAAGIGVAVLVPAWFAVHSVRRGLDDASRAMEKVFYAPGEA